MIKITAKDDVLTKLRLAFPTPTNAANSALGKYTAKLQELVNEAISRGRSAYDFKFNLYSIPANELSHKGAKLGTGSKQIRLHKWLKDNGLELIKIEKKGNNLDHTFSQIKLTNMVNVEDISLTAITPTITDPKELDKFLNGTRQDDEALFKKLYPDLLVDFDEKYLSDNFDQVPIDVQSLENYIEFLLVDSNHLYKGNKKEQYLRQAKIILSIANFTNGTCIHRKKKSIFGRTYYEGTSIQNVNKDLRNAMLGDCWEYDVSSSVIAWKMGFAKELITSKGLALDERRVFKTTIWYLEEKIEFMNAIKNKTFLTNTNVPKDLQIPLLKQALTALSFGARLTQSGWKTANGNWEKSALEEILLNRNERERFVKCTEVKEFVSEQNLLDNYLYEFIKNNRTELLLKPELRTSKHPSKAKVIAYLYQHGETQAMSIAYNYLDKHNKNVLAKIHDAFIVRDKLSGQLKQEIEYEMQQATRNNYWRLGEKKIKGYTPINHKAKLIEAEHKKHIEEESQLAREYMKTKNRTV